MAKNQEPWPRTLFGFRLLWPFGTVLGTTLFTICNPECIESASNDMVSHTGKVLYTTTANEHNRVLLQIVPDPRNIGGNFYTVCQTDAGDFAQGRIRLLGRRRIYANTNSALLGTALKGGSAGFFPDLFPPFSYQLVNRGHSSIKLR